MKKPITIVSLALLLLLTMLLVLQVCSTAQQPVQLISDMSQASSHIRIAPPAGVVPFGEPRAAQAADKLFLYHCAACHGNNGSGQSYVAAYEGMPAVGNLTTINKTPEELKLSLLQGRGAMPAFHSRINEAEADALIQYIITHLQKK